MRKKTLRIFALTFLLLSIVTISTITISMADVPVEPHAADAMWVEPSSVTFTSSNGTVGQKFNVTMWLNISATQTAFSYQIALKYNRTQLKCTRAGFTAGTKSQFMSAHATSGLITIDTSFLGNGSIMVAEASLDTAEPGPKAGSLSWAEFQILAVPTAGNLTSKFNISGQYKPGGAGDTWVDKTGSFDYLDPLSCYDSVYLFVGPSVPPTPGPLSVSISAPSISIYLGQSIHFTSTVTGGTPPYTAFQWFLNSTSVLGATSNNWTYTPVAVGSGAVYLNVTDTNGTTAQSNTLITTVSPPPAGAKIYVEPPEIINLTMGPSSTFYINITLASIPSLAVCQFNLTYDPQVLDWIGIEALRVQGEFPTATVMVRPGSVWVSLNYSTPISADPPTPTVSVHFHVNAYGITPLNLTDTSLLDPAGHPISHNEFDGLFSNIIRDVAVTNVVPALTWVYQGWSDDINVTAANLGNVSETFDVSAWYNTTLIGTITVTNLAAGAQTPVIITWNTTGVPEGNYTITGTASIVPYESNTANNIFVDGTVQVATVIHDVAITNVTPAKSWVYQGNPVNITVTAENLGNLSESFNVSAYADGNLIGTVPVTSLAPGIETTLMFQWDTTGVTPCHNYTISGKASILPHEFNTTNNNFTDGPIEVRIRGDINGDGKVDGKDLTLVAGAFGSYGPDFLYPGSPPSSNWNPDADINLDNKVDGKDLMALARNFGTSCGP